MTDADPTGVGGGVACDNGRADPRPGRRRAGPGAARQAAPPGGGGKALIDSYIDRAWYGDFLQFAAKERLFATFLTLSVDGGNDPAKRWDTARNAALSEILGFYGIGYWYTWQVTVLGLGPVWQSANRTARANAAQLLDDGHVMAFGSPSAVTVPTSTPPT